MYGNGVGIGREVILQVRPTREVPRLAHTASFVAATGAAAPLAVVRLSASTRRTNTSSSHRATATTAWAFALFALVLKKGYILRRTANLFQEQNDRVGL